MFEALLDLQRRRRMQAALPQILGNIQPPPAGPDIAPAPVPVMQPMQFQPVEIGGGSDAGSMTGLAIGQGVGRLLKERSPDLKPQAGGNPLGDLAQKGGGRHKFLGLFAEGGALRRPGDVAVVGDAGPEVAVNVGRGETRIVPINDEPTFDAVRKLGRERALRAMLMRMKASGGR
jgi:hypothetical protein